MNGLATSRELSRAGARVVMAVRNVQKGEDAARKLRDTAPNADVSVLELDLGDLSSVRESLTGVRYEFPTEARAG